MTFKTRKAAHVGNVFLNTEHYAETVSYTPSGGNASEITAIVDRDQVEVADARGQMEMHRARMVIAQSDVDQPARGDEVQTTEPDDSTATWRVDGWRYNDGMWTVVCVRIAQRELAGDGHRERI